MSDATLPIGLDWLVLLGIFLASWGAALGLQYLDTRRPR